MGDVGSALSGAMSGIGGLFGGGGGGAGGGGGGGGGSSPFDGSGFSGLNDIFSNLPADAFNQDPTAAQALAIQGPPNQPDPTSAGGGSQSQPFEQSSDPGQEGPTGRHWRPIAPMASPQQTADIGRSLGIKQPGDPYQPGAGNKYDQPPIQPKSQSTTNLNPATTPYGGAAQGPPQQPNTIDTTNLDPATTPYGGPAMGPRQATAGGQDPGMVNPAGISGDWYNKLRGAPDPNAADKSALGAGTAVGTAPADGAMQPGEQGGYGGYGGQGGFDVGNLFRAIMPMVMMMAMGGMGRGGIGAMLPMMMMSMLGGGQGGFPGMFRGGHLGRGYYPDGRGGMRFHPGGYHLGWGPGRNWAAARYGGGGGGGGGPVSLGGGGNWSGAGADGVQRQGSVRNLGQYINDRARATGVDPELAVGIASAEGLNANTVSRGGNADARGTTAYGPFQLNTSGLARNFQRETGLNPADPSTQFAQVDWVLNFIKNNPGALGNWMSIRDQGGLDNIRARGRRYIAGLGQGGGTKTASAAAPAADTSGADAWKRAQDVATYNPTRTASVSQLSSGGMNIGASPSPPPGGMDPNDPGYRDMPRARTVENRGTDPSVPTNARTSYDPRKVYVSPQGKAWAAANMPAELPTGYLPDPSRSPFIHQGSPETGYWIQTPDGRVIHQPGTDYNPAAAPMG